MANAGEPRDLQGVRVLVVEDQWHLSNTLKSLLSAEGLEVEGPAHNRRRPPVGQRARA
jgi:hypothetical protein